MPHRLYIIDIRVNYRLDAYMPYIYYNMHLLDATAFDASRFPGAARFFKLSPDRADNER